MKIIHNDGKITPAGGPPELVVTPTGGVEVGGVFQTILPNVSSFVVTAATHGLPMVRGVKVLSTSRGVIDAYVEQRDNGDVYVESTSSLLNHKIIIF